MKICTIIVTRSKSCSVKTLHTVLRLNIECIRRNVQNEILYVNDDPYEKINFIKKCMSKCDRIFFIDFGVNVDEASIKQVFETHEGIGVVVFPGVKEGIDWGLFKQKVKEGSTEPVSQMGLHFDTEVGKKASKDLYKVTKTGARVWVMMTKVIGKKGIKLSMPNMFDKMMEQGVKIFAFTASKLIMTYPHECISNILSAAGVKSN